MEKGEEEEKKAMRDIVQSQMKWKKKLGCEIGRNEYVSASNGVLAL